MEFGDTITVTLRNLPYQLPLCIVWIGGLVTAAVFFKRYPQVSLLTIGAIFLMAFIRLFDIYYSVSTGFLLRELDLEYTTITLIFNIIRSSISLCTGVVWIILLVAIFGWRKPKEESDSELPA